MNVLPVTDTYFFYEITLRFAKVFVSANVIGKLRSDVEICCRMPVSANTADLSIGSPHRRHIAFTILP